MNLTKNIQTKIIIESQLKEYVVVDYFEDGIRFIESSEYIRIYKLKNKKIDLPIVKLNPQVINNYNNAKKTYGEIEKEIRNLIAKKGII